MVVRLQINNFSSFPIIIILCKLNLIHLNYIGCRKNKNLQYDVAMNSFIIILNIEAILYMRTHKIPLNIYDAESLTFIVAFYFFFGAASCTIWVLAIKNVSLCETAYIPGRICHTFGFGVFLHLLYYISPALFVRLNFGLPCLLWFVAAMIGPCLYIEVQQLRDW